MRLLDSARSTLHKLSGWIGFERMTEYDFVKGENPNRRPVKRYVYPQDRKLKDQFRERAIATTQDIQANFAIVAWAIRKHLDYVSDFEFVPKMQSEEQNQQLATFMANWGNRFNFDVRQRHPLRRFIRQAELRRVVDGDFFALKIAGNGPNRGKIQPIEGSRIRNPDESDERWVNGVRLGNKGQAIRYALWHRTMDGNLEFDGEIPAHHMIPMGYYERFDQVRGISPLAAGVAEFIDVMDSVTLMKSKLKLQQLFAVALYQEPRAPTAVDGLPTAKADNDQDGIPESDWEFSFDGLPQQFTGTTGEKLEMIESRTPAAESVDFMRFVLSIALKALDLPDSFLRESDTNFFGSRAAFQQYMTSARSKRQDLTEFLNELTRWRIGMAVADEELQLGVPFDDIRWEWRHVGQPWMWDPQKEAKGHQMAIAMGVDSIERACAMNGTTPKQNIDELARWNQYAIDTLGAPLDYANTAPAQEPAETEPETEELVDENV